MEATNHPIPYINYCPGGKTKPSLIALTVAKKTRKLLQCTQYHQLAVVSAARFQHCSTCACGNSDAPATETLDVLAAGGKHGLV